LAKDGEKKRKSEKQQRKAEKLEKERPEQKLNRGLGIERAPRGRSERLKPGAALALAQRGTAAILPSQGQKITF
jgi:hypothetical protein